MKPREIEASSKSIKGNDTKKETNRSRLADRQTGHIQRFNTCRESWRKRPGKWLENVWLIIVLLQIANELSLSFCFCCFTGQRQRVKSANPSQSALTYETPPVDCSLSPPAAFFFCFYSSPFVPVRFFMFLHSFWVVCPVVIPPAAILRFHLTNGQQRSWPLGSAFWNILRLLPSCALVSRPSYANGAQPRVWMTATKTNNRSVWDGAKLKQRVSNTRKSLRFLAVWWFVRVCGCHFWLLGGKAEGARLPGRTKVTGLALLKVAVRACRCTAFPAYGSTVTCSSADFYLSPFIFYISPLHLPSINTLSPSQSVTKILFHFSGGGRVCSGKLEDGTERSFSFRRQISNLWSASFKRRENSTSAPFISGRVLHLEKVVVQQKGEITRVFYYYFLRLSLEIKIFKFPPNGLCVESFKKWEVVTIKSLNIVTWLTFNLLFFFTQVTRGIGRRTC